MCKSCACQVLLESQITNANWTVPDDNAAVKVGTARCKPASPITQIRAALFPLCGAAGRFMTSAVAVCTSKPLLFRMCNARVLLSFYERDHNVLVNVINFLVCGQNSKYKTLRSGVVFRTEPVSCWGLRVPARFYCRFRFMLQFSRGFMSLGKLQALN